MKTIKNKIINILNIILHVIISVCWMMLCFIVPIMICILPAIGYVITNNINCMWLLILSLPVGIMVGNKALKFKFIMKFINIIGINI